MCGHLWVQQWAGPATKTQQRAALVTRTYSSGRTQRKSAKGKSARREVWREPAVSSRESSLSGVTQDTFNFSRDTLRQHVQKVASQGTSQDTRHPRMTLRDDRVRTPCPARVKIPAPQKDHTLCTGHEGTVRLSYPVWKVLYQYKAQPTSHTPRCPQVNQAGRPSC